jgi:hypothetical protein
MMTRTYKATREVLHIPARDKLEPGRFYNCRTGKELKMRGWRMGV